MSTLFDSYVFSYFYLKSFIFDLHNSGNILIYCKNNNQAINTSYCEKFPPPAGTMETHNFWIDFELIVYD